MASARASASLPRRIAAVIYESMLLGALVLALGFATQASFARADRKRGYAL